MLLQSNAGGSGVGGRARRSNNGRGDGRQRHHPVYEPEEVRREGFTYFSIGRA
jgi:hypothetical protein